MDWCMNWSYCSFPNFSWLVILSFISDDIICGVPWAFLTLTLQDSGLVIRRSGSLHHVNSLILWPLASHLTSLGLYFLILNWGYWGRQSLRSSPVLKSNDSTTNCQKIWVGFVAVMWRVRKRTVSPRALFYDQELTTFPVAVLCICQAFYIWQLSSSSFLLLPFHR